MGFLVFLSCWYLMGFLLLLLTNYLLVNFLEEDSLSRGQLLGLSLIGLWSLVLLTWAVWKIIINLELELTLPDKLTNFLQKKVINKE